MSSQSLEGRCFSHQSGEHAGDVDANTRFDYHQEDRVIWARYRGGQIALGFLVGTREGDHLAFRYSHVTRSGHTASGRCSTRIEQRTNGFLRLHETWQWESQPGSGTSILDEVKHSTGSPPKR